MPLLLDKTCKLICTLNDSITILFYRFSMQWWNLLLPLPKNIYIYIICQTKEYFYVLFFEIVKNLVASEKYLEYCKTLIINLYIVWKSQMYCPSGLTMQDLFFVTEIDNTLTVRNPSSRQSKPAIVSQNAYYNTPDWR